MINGLHVLLYSNDAESDRAFVRDILGLEFVDVGHGWLIFAAPPTELAVHPAENSGEHQIHAGHAMAGAVLYFMCDDLQATIRSLQAKKVECTEVEQEPWGMKTTIRLPSGSEVGLYQPLHETAIKTR